MSNNLFRVGEFYPPVEHQDRINRYKENKKLFKGLHHEVFGNFNGSDRNKELLYISINLAGIICKKSADFLFGEAVRVKAGTGDATNEQKVLDSLIENNDMNILNYESALSNAYRGDSFYKIRYGQEHGGMLPKEIDIPRVIIEAQNAEFVFPEADLYNYSKIKAVHIAVPIHENESSNAGWILDVESHYAGYIEYRRFSMQAISFDARGNASEWRITGEQPEQNTVVATGVPYPLIVHIPNYSTDDTWEGIDDITEFRPIFDEINNRLSQIASILDKHSDPALAVPSGILGEDQDGRPTFRVAHDKVFEVMGKEDVIPQYITWNGQLNEAFQELDRLVELLLAAAEIPSVALGKGDSGTSGASGLAIKWRMNSLLSKINRKRQYYMKGLKQVLLVAQLLDHAVGAADYKIVTPILQFQEGLPKDKMEEANIMAIRTKGEKTMSLKSALMLYDGITEEQAETEINRIMTESQTIPNKEEEASNQVA